MVTRCEYIDPIVGDRCSSDATLRAPGVDYSMGVLPAREVQLCRRHYDQLWLAALVGAAERV